MVTDTSDDVDIAGVKVTLRVNEEVCAYTGFNGWCWLKFNCCRRSRK